MTKATQAITIKEKDTDRYNTALFHTTAIQESGIEIVRNYLLLGFHFKKLKEKDLYKNMWGDDSWVDFCAHLKVSRSFVYACMQIHDVYCDLLHIPAEILSNVSFTALRTLLPIARQNIYKDTLEWIKDANTLSTSDFINKVNDYLGKPPMLPASSTQVDDGELPKTYRDYVLASPCIVCRKTTVEPAHFPRTKKRGGKFIIPLCHLHHGEYHQCGRITFVHKYFLQDSTLTNLGEFLEGWMELK